MKLYTVKKGTRGIVFNESNMDDLKHIEYVTTKDLEFFDTVIDPVRYANIQNGHIPVSPDWVPAMYAGLAAAGYAIFRDYENPGHALAVLYKTVKVM
jgi:hypothetical protein